MPRKSIDTRTDRRFDRRNKDGQFKESDNTDATARVDYDAVKRAWDRILG